MSIYAIADLHLSFAQNKPMDIFGNNWENHAEKIKKNWILKVKEEDFVLLPGDFSWGIDLNEAKADFAFLNELPGNKIMLKGNHDYWWTTLKSMRKFLNENSFEKIDFLYNNSYCIENKVIVGTRGWNVLDTEDEKKMIKRESIRLELSIQDGIKKYGKSKEIIALLHYPPLTLNMQKNNIDSEFTKILKKYNIKKCYYGHLHGQSHKTAVMGMVNGIYYELISADYLNFNLIKIE